MNTRKIKALADARAARGGLVRGSGSWFAETLGAEGHDPRTIQSLVDRGLLRLWLHGTAAHITPLGEQTLEEIA